MCKAILIINKNNKNNEVIKNFIDFNVGELLTQRDGYSTYRDGDIAHFMGEPAYSHSLARENFKYDGETMYMAHARIATGGGRTIEGLHLQRLQDRYIFMHNGTVSKIFNTDRSDSYYFFKNIIEAGKTDIIYRDKIVKQIEKDGFSGKGFLYDEVTDEMHIFMNSTMYIYLLPDALIATTWDANIRGYSSTFKEVLGYSYEYREELDEIEFLHKGRVDDSYLVFKDKRLVARHEIPRRAYAGYAGWDGYGSYGSYGTKSKVPVTYPINNAKKKKKKQKISKKKRMGSLVVRLLRLNKVKQLLRL